MAYKLLDLFCGVGGASTGYAKAGFEITGIDIKVQPRYPYEFYRGDALIALNNPKFLAQFHAIHASPPCQAYSSATPNPSLHPDLIPLVRKLLVESGLPWIIENVPGSPLIKPLRLCGSSFGLRVRRHRLFETNFRIVGPPCDHGWQDNSPIYDYITVSESNRRKSGIVGIYGGGSGLGVMETKIWEDVMEIKGATMKEIGQAIPLAYTQYIGDRLRRTMIDRERVGRINGARP